MPERENQKPIFTLPPREVFRDALLAGDYGYSLSNYYGRGPIARSKRQRFQIALDLAMPTAAARTGAGREAALDMGSADGVFLPTLCRYYRRAVAIDNNRQLAGFCSALIRSLRLDNAECVLNEGMSFDELRARIGAGFDVMYLLETLEHVGSQPDLWGTKIEFLRGCFQLLKPGGSIVISVPRMVGPIVIFKSLVQRALRMRHDKLTLRQLVRSGIFRRTDELEPLWVGTSHVGFNHLKLERHMTAHFQIARRKQTAISVFYVIQART